MRSVLHELSRMGGWGEGVCISSERGTGRGKRGRKYTPEQARQINFASSICIVCFLFLFPSSSLFRLRRE